MANSDTKTQGSRDRIVLIQFSQVGKAEVVGAMRRAFLASLARSGFHKPRHAAQPALRSFFPGVSSAASNRGASSSQSNESARAVVSMDSSSGMSSATGAPSSVNFLAETST